MYHVALDLSPEQKKQLKLLATTEGKYVSLFITELVLKRLTQKSGQGVK